MNLKLKKNRGLTLALMILAACMICLLVPIMSVSAKTKSGRYEFYKNWNSSKWVKIKNHKMTTFVSGTYYKNTRGKDLKKKKRKFIISKNCRFYVTTPKKKTKRISYKSFTKCSKENRILYLWVKKGKIVKAQWHNWYGTGSY